VPNIDLSWREYVSNLAFVHPCMLDSYIFSSLSLPGNVKAALCVRFVHLTNDMRPKVHTCFYLVSAVKLCLYHENQRLQLQKGSKASPFSSGTLCRDRGALMCNTQSWNLVKMTSKPLTSGILASIQIVASDLFCSHPISLLYLRSILFLQQWQQSYKTV